MKVAINTGDGSFSLSEEAIIRLIERQAECVQKREFEKYYKNSPNRNTREIRDGYLGDSFITGVISKDGLVYFLNNSSLDVDTRTDKNLIAVIEEMGEEANGSYCEIKIEEVEDNLNFVINETDEGLESISLEDE